MDAARLRRELQAGTTRPCYCLSGPETFTIEESLKLLIGAALAPEERELGVVRLQADECGVEEVLTEARTLPFLSSKRVVVVRRAEAWEGLFTAHRRAAPAEEGEEAEEAPAEEARPEALRQSLLDYLADPNPTTHLVFVAARTDGRLPVVRKLKEMGVLVECGPLGDEAASRWVRDRSGALGVGLSPEEAALLVEHVGPDLQRLARELEKLTQYSGPGGPGVAEAIERLVAGGRERSAFDLTDAIARRDAERALRRLETLLTIGEGDGPLHPLKVLGSLAWQVRRLWLVKDSLRRGLSDLDTYGRISRTPVKGISSWHRRQLKELREAAKCLSEADLSRVFRRLLQADAELKGVGTSDRRALEALVLDLCGVAGAERAER